MGLAAKGRSFRSPPRAKRGRLVKFEGKPAREAGRGTLTLSPRAPRRRLCPLVRKNLWRLRRAAHVGLRSSALENAISSSKALFQARKDVGRRRSETLLTRHWRGKLRRAGPSRRFTHGPNPTRSASSAGAARTTSSPSTLALSSSRHDRLSDKQLAYAERPNLRGLMKPLAHRRQPHARWLGMSICAGSGATRARETEKLDIATGRDALRSRAGLQPRRDRVRSAATPRGVRRGPCATAPGGFSGQATEAGSRQPAPAFGRVGGLGGAEKRSRDLFCWARGAFA